MMVNAISYFLLNWQGKIKCAKLPEFGGTFGFQKNLQFFGKKTKNIPIKKFNDCQANLFFWRQAVSDELTKNTGNQVVT